LVLKNFSTLIKDIQSFGGEEALLTEYGTVFLSILFNDDVDATTKQITKDSIQDLAKQLSVASFALKFDDPVTTFVGTNTFFQFNPSLTTLSNNTIKDTVNSEIRKYFEENTGKFGQSYRRSNMLTLVDDISPAILSSRSETFVQRRFTPTLTKIEDQTLRYAVLLAAPDDVDYIITSSSFSFKNKICVLRNKLGSNKLEVFNTEDKIVVVDNVGSYEGDTVSIVGIQIDNYIGTNQFIKVIAKPSNESALTPLRADILEIDNTQTTTNIVELDTSVGN